MPSASSNSTGGSRASPSCRSTQRTTTHPLTHSFPSLGKRCSSSLTHPRASKGEHFKFLGRWVHYYSDEAGIKERIRSTFEDDLQTVAAANVNGFMKLWLYERYVLSRHSWSLMVHDLDRSFASGLQTHAQALLKRWAGVGKRVDEGVLYRSRENFGLQLTSVTDYYDSMQLVRAQLLKNSADPDIRTLWEARRAREAKLLRVQKVSKLYSAVEAQVTLNLRYPRQQGRQGLGAGTFNPDPTPAERRKLVSATARAFAEEKRVQHSHRLAQQGGCGPNRTTWPSPSTSPGRT